MRLAPQFFAASIYDFSSSVDNVIRSSHHSKIDIGVASGRKLLERDLSFLEYVYDEYIEYNFILFGVANLNNYPF